jgi:hypothetical protein
MSVFSNLRQRARHYVACLGVPHLRLGVGLVLALGCAQPLHAQATKIIRNDPGGPVTARLQEIARLRSTGIRIEIRGNCASACTLYLGLPNTCVALSSRLGFHGPQSQYYGVSLPPPEFEHWSRIMAGHYPGAMRAWFMDEVRQTTMGLVTISGAQARAPMRMACAQGA